MFHTKFVKGTKVEYITTGLLLNMLLPIIFCSCVELEGSEEETPYLPGPPAKLACCMPSLCRAAWGTTVRGSRERWQTWKQKREKSKFGLICHKEKDV